MVDLLCAMLACRGVLVFYESWLAPIRFAKSSLFMTAVLCSLAYSPREAGLDGDCH